MAWTTDDLIDDVVRRAMLPDARTATLPDADLLAFGDGVLRELIVPRIMACREDFFLATKDVAVTAGQQAYRIPPRAIGRKLRDVRFIDSNGNGSAPLSLIPVEELDDYAGLTGVFSSGRVCIDGDVVKLVPTPSITSGTLRMRYYRFPSQLVLESACAHVTSAVGDGIGLNVTNGQSAWDDGVLVDVIMGASGFDILNMDALTAAATTATVEFGTGVLSSEADAGDWIAAAGTTPVPQIPMEWHSVLAQGIAVKALEALKDVQGVQIAQAKLDIALRDALRLLAPRVDAHPKKVGAGSRSGGLLRNRARVWWPR